MAALSSRWCSKGPKREPPKGVDKKVFIEDCSLLRVSVCSLFLYVVASDLPEKSQRVPEGASYKELLIRGSL